MDKKKRDLAIMFTVIFVFVGGLASLMVKKDTPQWEKDFVKYHLSLSIDFYKIDIDGSELHVYTSRISDTFNTSAEVIAYDFQSTYSQNTGRKNITAYFYLDKKQIRVINL